MKKTYVRLLSILTALLLVLTTAFSLPVKAASVNTGSSGNAKKAELARKAYQNYLTKLGTKSLEITNLNDNGSPNQSINDVASTDPNKVVRVIVQLNENSIKDYASNQSLSKAALNTALINKVAASQTKYKSRILKIDSTIKFRNTYNLLLNGFSFETKYKNVESIKNISGVKNVTIAKEFYPDMNSAKSITNVTNVWQQLGLKGEGLVVSIIDTGIDYTHKDMVISDSSKDKVKLKSETPAGPGKFFTLKVPYGHNFADNNNDVVDRTSSMHGMHVAGIVAANCQSDAEIAANNGIKGVAPEAQLLAMKVFSNRPAAQNSAFSDDIVAAIEDSVKHDADVINMSLGSTASFQDPEDAELVAVREANEAGTVCVISAGNSYYATWPYKLPGVNDTGLVGSPGLAHESLQVASYENTNVVGPALDYSNDTESGLSYYTTSEVDPLTVLKDKNGYLLVDCGYGNPSDFTGKDLTGKIALISRGSISFVDKKYNAQVAGAKGVIVYNNAAGYLNMATDPKVTIPGVFISMADGQKLKSLIASNVRVTFKGSVANIPNSLSGNMSDFSSWGPTPNLDFKPQITAPGGNIWSTVNNNKYENMSGTSMASPHMAGITALIVQHINSTFPDLEKGKDKAELAKTLAINTAVPMLDPATKGVKYFSPRRQGAGLADAEAAIKNNVTITDADNEATVALKEIPQVIETTIDENGNDVQTVKDATKTFTLKLHNYGTEDAVYNVNDLSGVLTEQTGLKNNTMSYDVALTGATVNFDNNQVTVPKGGDATVNVTLTIPAAAPTNIFVEGFIRFVPVTTGIPTIGVPYMGFYGKWDSLAIFDAPAWDDENTWLGETTLLGKRGEDYYYLGQTSNGIDQTKIAISPLPGTFNAVAPYVTLFRNAKTTIVKILDSENNVIRTAAVLESQRKTVFDSSKGIYASLISRGLWDGTVYNTKTGKYEPVSDGQYYVQINSVIDYPNAQPQTLTMPVQVDSGVPVVENVAVEKNEDGTFKVNVKAHDDGIGIQDLMIIVNGDFENPVFADSNGDGTFTADKVKSVNNGQTFNTFDVFAFDYANNLGYGFGEDVSVSATFDNVEPGSIYGAPDLNEEGKLVITGTLNGAPSEFKINGMDVSIDYYDLTFKSQPIELKDGLNKIAIYMKGYNGDITDYAYNTYYDAFKPVISVDGIDLSKDTTYVYVPDTQTSIQLKGKVTDNPSFSCDFYVNGEQIIDVDYDSFPTKGLEKEFNETVALNDNVTTIELKAVDMSLNETVKKIIVTKDTAPSITINKTTVSGKTVTISGTIENMNKGYINLFIFGKKFVVKNNSTSVNFTKTITLRDYGKYVINITAVDSKGKTAEIDLTDIETNEKIKPVVKLVNPKSSTGTTANETYDVLFSVSDDTPYGLTVTAKVGANDNAVEQLANGLYKTTITVPADGRTYGTVVISAKDKWNNLTTQTVKVKKATDKKGPELTIIAPTSTTVTTDTVAFKISAIDYEQSGIEYVEIYDKTGEDLIAIAEYNSESGYYECTVELETGRNYFKVLTEDGAGNVSNKTITITKK